MIIEQITILILALAGFGVSYYIYRSSRPGKQLSCPIGDHDCGKVIGSKYGKTFGIKNEIAGMFYYGILAAIYLISLFFPIFKISGAISMLSIITGAAAMFSVYLTLVQIFAIKEFCQWCLASAVLALTIFVLFVI